jgi:hypothetical protein
MNGVDQLGDFIERELGLVGRWRLADPQEIFRLAGGKASGEDRHLGSVTAERDPAGENRASQPIHAETV